jgi:hypothetical protein
MSWVPPGFVDASALAGQRGADRVRDDLFEGRLKAYRWDGERAVIFRIEPSLWCAADAERWLVTGWAPAPDFDPDGDECRVIVRVEEDEPVPPPAADGGLLAEFMALPFIALMYEAFCHFRTSGQSGSKIDVFKAHFLAREVAGEQISGKKAAVMATCIRPPEAMRGGNRKKG